MPKVQATPVFAWASKLTHTIGSDQSMAEAGIRMRRHKIRHLPVLEGGRLVGIVTERDLALVESLPGVDPERLPVTEAMTANPYTVDPDMPLAHVVVEMAKHKYGSAVLVDGDNPVAIFTTVDALQACADLLAELDAS